MDLQLNSSTEHSAEGVGHQAVADLEGAKPAQPLLPPFVRATA